MRKEKHTKRDNEKKSILHKCLWSGCSLGLALVASAIMPEVINKGGAYLYKCQNRRRKDNYADQEPIIMKKSDLNQSE